MPGVNPFGASYLYATNSSQAKTKKEAALCPQTNFHQRPIKIEKAQGRLTPLLTGRVTPSLNTYKAPPSNNDKPASNKAIKNTEQQKQQHQTTEPKIEIKVSNDTTTTKNSIPASSQNPFSNNFFHTKTRVGNKAIYSIPKTFKLSRPTLETGVLEIRTSIMPIEDMQIKSEEEFISPNSVFRDDDNLQL